MIKAITVTNHLGDSIKLELARPEKSGFIITSIDGLGPGSATINTSEVSTNDGSTYNSARVSSRNIVFHIRYLWKETIEDARQLSYKYFPLKKKVTLLIETDNRTSEIDGYVESNEPDIFSKEEGSDISLICPNPFFYSAFENQMVSFSGIEAGFEFPFGNESLTDDLLEFSIIRDNIDRVIDYQGDCDIGVTIRIHASGEAKNIAIYNVGTREVMKLNTDTIVAYTGTGIVNEDEIVICTVKNQKSVTLIRNAKSVNILNCVDKTSDWFQLSKGDNIFAYTAEEGRNNLLVEIENRVAYEGV